MVRWIFVSGIEVLFVWRQFLEWKRWKFQPEYTLLFKLSIMENFVSKKGGNDCSPNQSNSVIQTIYSRKFCEWKRWKLCGLKTSCLITVGSSNQRILYLFQPQIVGSSNLYFIMSVACVEVSDKSGELACFWFSPFVCSAELSTVYI